MISNSLQKHSAFLKNDCYRVSLADRLLKLNKWIKPEGVGNSVNFYIKKTKKCAFSGLYTSVSLKLFINSVFKKNGGEILEAFYSF